MRSYGRRRTYFATDVAGTHGDIQGIFETKAYLCLRYIYIVEQDVEDRLGLSTLEHKGCLLHIVTLQSVDENISDGREVMIVLHFTSITTGDIKEVFHLVETSVLHIHILCKTTAVGIGLDEDAALAIARIVAVFYNHVSHTCRHFASYHHSVQSLEMAVADNDVL